MKISPLLFIAICVAELIAAQTPVSRVSSLNPLKVHAFDTLMGNPGLGDTAEKLPPPDDEEQLLIGHIFADQIHLLTAEPVHSIPHKIHFIWIGSKPVSTSSIENIKSWMKLHPGWEVCFWNDNPETPVPVPGMTKCLVQSLRECPLYSLIERSDNIGEKADMIRYSILWLEGGVYADTDVVCVRPFDVWVNHFDFIIGLERSHYHANINSSIIPCNALIASQPKHPILEQTAKRVMAMWDHIGQKFPGTDRRSIHDRVVQRTFDPLALTTKALYNDPVYRNIILPVIYFHSRGAFSPEEQKQYIDEGLVWAIHQSRPSGAFEDNGAISWLPSTP